MTNIIDTVMIGAGPSALAAAVYTTREDIDTVLYEKGVIGGLAAIEIAQKSGLFTYVYTINRPQAAAIMEKRGIDGIVTDYPDRLNKLPKR